jgi:scyllo-inositol 2-dehydrogenase (NADP+)
MNPIITSLLSYGMSGEVFHAPLLQAHPGFQLHTIVQRKSASAHLRYPDAKIVTTVEAAIHDPAVELIIVNTPNELHVEHARQSLLAGKHAVVEKPFTVTAAEADELIALAKEKKLMLTAFQNRRWDGGFLTVKKILDENRLGKLAEYEAHYDRFRNYIQPATWKEETGRGTGILYNLGSHMIDQALVLFGMPTEVDARIGIQRAGGKVDDFYDIRMQYEKFLVIIKSSYLVCEPGPQYTLHGTEGSFIKYGIDPQEEALKAGGIPGGKDWGREPKEYWGKLKTVVGNGYHTEIVETLPGNYLGFYQNIYEVVREGKPLAVKAEEAREVIRIIEDCYESNRLRKAIRIT